MRDKKRQAREDQVAALRTMIDYQVKWATEPGRPRPLMIQLRPCPDNRNDDRACHWGRRKDEKLRVMNEVKAAVCNHRARDPLPRPPVLVELRRRGWNRMDVTGVVEAAKPVLDALVELGVLPGDDPRYVPQAPIVMANEIDRSVRFSELVVILHELRLPSPDEGGRAA